MEGRVDLDHPGIERPGVELVIDSLSIAMADALTTTPPSQVMSTFITPNSNSVAIARIGLYCTNLCRDLNRRSRNKFPLEIYFQHNPRQHVNCILRLHLLLNPKPYNTYFILRPMGSTWVAAVT